VAAWRKSRVSAFRDFIRFYESLSVLALFSRDETREPSKTVS
jgi:hypothetical protein